MTCRYWFFNQGFKFQGSVCNSCHELTILSANISDIAIITVKNVNYRCIIHNISKSETFNLLKFLFLKIVYIYIYKNIVLNFSLLKAVFLLFLLSIYKMVEKSK